MSGRALFVGILGVGWFTLKLLQTMLTGMGVSTESRGIYLALQLFHLVPILFVQCRELF